MMTNSVVIQSLQNKAIDTAYTFQVTTNAIYSFHASDRQQLCLLLIVDRSFSV